MISMQKSNVLISLAFLVASTFAAGQSGLNGYSEASLSPTYAVDSGTVNALVVSLVSCPKAYTTGMTVRVMPAYANTSTTPTVNVCGLGVKTIVKSPEIPLSLNDLITSIAAVMVYDGTNMELQNPATAITAPIGTLVNTLTSNQAPLGVAVDSAGAVIVADHNNSGTAYLQKWLPNGTLSYSTSIANGAETVAVDIYDNAWTCEYQNGYVTKVSTAGTATAYLIYSGSNVGCQAISPDRWGNVWLSMGTVSGSTYLVQINQTGSVLQTITPPDSPAGTAAMTLDASGNIWMLYTANGSAANTSEVVEFSAAGAQLAKYTGFNTCGYAGSLTLDLLGNFWAVCGTALALKFNAAGTNLFTAPLPAETFGTSTTSVTIGTGSQTFTTQSGLGTWLVGGRTLMIQYNAANYMIGTITSYSGTTLVMSIATLVGSGTYASWNIDGIGPAAGAIDAANNFWVPSKYLPGGVVISSNGAQITSFGEGGQSITIAADGAGNMWTGQDINTSVYQLSTGGIRGLLTPLIAQISQQSSGIFSSIAAPGVIPWSSGGTCTYNANYAIQAFGSLSTTASQTCTLSPTNLIVGGSYNLEIIEASGSAATLTLGTAGSCSAWKVINSGAGAVTLQGSSSRDMLSFVFDGTYCIATFGTKAT
jgi:hypothetical protein